ncbi:MAG: hypothetical protein ACI82A_002703 [Candidatus Azotimanducaceae bacterium]|jgi:hypothetical protein
MKYSGGCHCRAVRFEVEAGTRVVCQDCNGSICAKFWLYSPDRSKVKIQPHSRP